MGSRFIRVLQFTNSSVRGGAEEHILTLLQGLDRSRFSLLFAAPPRLLDFMQDDIPKDVELIPLNLRSPGDVLGAWRFAHTLRRVHVDIVHSHLFWSSLVASPVAWLCRVPVIVETPHVRERWRKGWKAKFFVDRMVGRCVTFYIAVSAANRHYLVTEKRLPSSKIVVIRNGTNLTRFHPEHQAPLDLRSELGIGKQDPILIVAGRLEPQKGHRFLLQAMTRIRQEFPTVRLIIAGDGSLRQSLEQLVSILHLNDNVRFVGQQNRIQDWLAVADVSVLPSLYEGLPLVAIESLAAGRPIVATAVDGTPEAVLHEKTGLTVPPGNPESLAEAVCRLLCSVQLREQFGRAGRKLAVCEFDQASQIHQTEDFYLQALKCHSQLFDMASVVTQKSFPN